MTTTPGSLALTIAQVIEEYGYQSSACSACARLLQEALPRHAGNGYTAESVIDALYSFTAWTRGGDYILDLDRFAEDVSRGYCPIGTTI